MNINEVINWLRGETSQPLMLELNRILTRLSQSHENSCAVQVPTTLARNGLSLLIYRTEPTLTVTIYYSRDEIPGYLSFPKLGQIDALKWQIHNDRLGMKYACVWRIYPTWGIHEVVEEMCRVLETLGVPRRKSWELEARFGTYRDGEHTFTTTL